MVVFFLILNYSSSSIAGADSFDLPKKFALLPKGSYIPTVLITPAEAKKMLWYI